ncbi:MAG: DUF2797 domain-containing protein [Bacteroidota bacterium]
MRVTGRILKMKSQLSDQVIYHLPLEDKLIQMNDLIGKNIVLKYENEIYCIACGKRTNKSFSQGFCWNCFISSPETAECILRPELCLAHEGKGRDMEWEKKHHLQEHFVYLAFSSEVKVGVTRSTQVPTRWIDQGASSVIRLAKVPYRYLAGVIEVEMKKHFTDKTNWQKMLKGDAGEGKDLVAEKKRSKELISAKLQQYFSDDDSITTINYPVIKYPEKVKSIDFEKQNLVSGKLIGIKGQYLIMEDNSVLNIRKHSGYVVSIEM